MTAGQFIDYESLAQDAMQEAMRGVVRAVLAKVAASGLSGDHHFYIAFHTQAPGVTISKRLKEKYPLEMTIVLQHRFWDLEVGDDKFSVKLTFDGIPERLIVPFKALKVFYDPSVPYGLQFEEGEGLGTPRPSFAPGHETDPAGEQAMADGDRMAGQPRPAGVERPERRTDRPKRPRVERVERARAEEQADEGSTAAQRPVPTAVPSPEQRDDDAKPVPLTPPRPQPVAGTAKPSEDAPEAAPATTGGGAKVVDLSAFRPKKK
ncbi:MAG TPA: ClpXP protease specificity-enhancing factor SspB [Hyphomicrobiaceae bacterium]|nr:ClpXP protease specificity-enhancing factor SspB [Hyphomicrobiaceae bacterium]